MSVPLILYIEDNPGDASLLAEGLADSRLEAELEIIRHGDHAMARLDGADPYRGARQPDLVILDLNLPGFYGHELLSLIRDHERIADIRVAILTSSDDPEERAFCLARKADAFLIKPMGMDGYREIAKTLEALLIPLAGVGRQRRSRA